MALQNAEWPPLLFPREAEFFPATQTVSGGQSISGSEQVISSGGAGRWRAVMSVPVRGEERVLALRAMLAGLEGRLGTILVPKWDRFRQRDINGRRFSEVGATAYGDCSLNFDLSGWGQDENPPASTGESSALGSTQISVNYAPGIDGVRPGQYFGIGPRLHIVQQVWAEDEEGASTIRFWPPLRSAVEEGTAVILDRPVCLMRLASDDAGQTVLTRRAHGVAQLEFVEAY